MALSTCCPTHARVGANFAAAANRLAAIKIPSILPGFPAPGPPTGTGRGCKAAISAGSRPHAANNSPWHLFRAATAELPRDNSRVTLNFPAAPIVTSCVVPIDDSSAASPSNPTRNRPLKFGILAKSPSNDRDAFCGTRVRVIGTWLLSLGSDFPPITRSNWFGPELRPRIKTTLLSLSPNSPTIRHSSGEYCKFHGPAGRSTCSVTELLVGSTEGADASARASTAAKTVSTGNPFPSGRHSLSNVAERIVVGKSVIR
jgi:hypothetical protein